MKTKIKQIQKLYDRLLQSESVCTDLGIQSYSGNKGEFQVYQLDYFITNAKIVYLSLVIRIQKSKVLITPYFGGRRLKTDSTILAELHLHALADIDKYIKSKKKITKS